MIRNSHEIQELTPKKCVLVATPARKKNAKLEFLFFTTNVLCVSSIKIILRMRVIGYIIELYFETTRDLYMC